MPASATTLRTNRSPVAYCLTLVSNPIACWKTFDPPRASPVAQGVAHAIEIVHPALGDGVHHERR
jgi:hypothetical protein